MERGRARNFRVNFLGDMGELFGTCEWGTSGTGSWSVLGRGKAAEGEAPSHLYQIYGFKGMHQQIRQAGDSILLHLVNASVLVRKRLTSGCLHFWRNGRPYAIMLQTRSWRVDLTVNFTLLTEHRGFHHAKRLTGQRLSIFPVILHTVARRYRRLRKGVMGPFPSCGLEVSIT